MLLGHVVMAQYAMTEVTEVLEKVSLGDIRELDFFSVLSLALLFNCLLELVVMGFLLIQGVVVYVF